MNQLPAKLLYNALLRRQPKKPRVFVSYHHQNDQARYNNFSTLFSDYYEIFTDTSLERRIDSDDMDYVDRRIREKYITGSSITVVLCGRETWKRKCIDWEIHSTLAKQHALLGILLPGHIPNPDGIFVVPDRLNDNINSGYAHWISWTRSAQPIDAAIREALRRASWTDSIVNNRPQMGRNLS